MSARRQGVGAPRGRAAGGFTVIEVMVSILLLAVAVVSIFGAQFAAVATADYSRHVTQAVQLARCRMSELELQFQLEDGFEEGDVIETGECCEAVEGEDDIAPFTCSWEVKMIEFPDISQMMTGGGADGGMMDDMLGGGMDGLLGGGGDDDLGGGMDELGMGLAQSFGPMVIEILQGAIRRVTVKVEWDQGEAHKELEVVQYVTHPTQGPLEVLQQAAALSDLEDEAETEGGFGATPSGEQVKGGGRNER